ncbi:MAG TPA: efflux transporter periplasmic adaptor subunit [Hydrogenophaga sp.]|uniref:efflux RND transporter periplasmic adaptor subunit n=1 Tax=Hydrogenophaga sp. TaxID=1904254 RepID=UPI0008AA79E9|nr:efflux RND transporter periplasmic adaptor subunit [Hydrogenophaga sp.]OGA78986.1 MAG: efflux transporter periplasmic adaptor subunit [Burkholderiales bacterium GWE1_65_30]OGA91876.1 MAG: efflux transporter periplasmic adaptor subunit [Burkholderiales bacterium GWF1_66_17]HAX21169.1 efflux transporter periplasmic adaptor subunit [Hydrogenophaga sp.]HBU19074.1 efflux transporter periplasmic adaptor subunit [Hydrogenophaga sp.]
MKTLRHFSADPTTRLVAAVLLTSVLAVACGKDEKAAAAEGAAASPAATAAEPGAAPAAAKPAMTVTTARPETASLALQLQANGNIAAWQEASVGAEVPGLRLATVSVNIGDVVKKGQVLATFARETAEAENLQGKAALMQAEAAAESAKADADRARSIENTGALSKSQIAQYQMQEKVTRAQHEAAKAAYAATQVRLGNTQVRSPDEGVISARTATVGAVAGAGQELFRLVRQSRMEWRAEVTPSEVGQVKVGQKVEVTAASGLKVAGTVRAIAPTADPQTRNVLVFADLPKHAELKAGTFARGLFQIGASQALTVPAQSIVVRDGHNYVFVIDAASKASQRKVMTGRRVGERVEVLSGLKADEAVAVQGAGFLNEGDLVKIVQ